MDEIRNKLKYLAVDVAKANEEYINAEEENTMMLKRLDRLQNFDEIHVEFDILSQSGQGIEMLKKKYGNIYQAY